MKKSEQHSWFPYWQQNAASSVRLFCFAYAGGSAAAYRSWSGPLSPDVEVLGVQLPGRERRLREQPCRSIAEIVDRFLEACLVQLCEKPFALFGHSLGARVTFELSRRLQTLGGPTPIHLFVSGCIAPHLRDRAPRIHNLSDREFLADLRRLGGTPEEVLQDEGMMAILLPYMRADYAASENYRYEKGEPIQAPMAAFGGTRDPDVWEQELVEWRRLAGQDFRYRLFEGDHFFIKSDESRLLSEIRQTLVGEARAQPTPPAP